MYPLWHCVCVRGALKARAMNLLQMYCQVLGIRIFVSQIHSRIILMRIGPVKLSIAKQDRSFVFIANVLPGLST